jgi:hypothetical protein
MNYRITIWDIQGKEKKLNLFFFPFDKIIKLIQILKINSNFIELNENSIKSKFNWIWGF